MLAPEANFQKYKSYLNKNNWGLKHLCVWVISVYIHIYMRISTHIQYAIHSKAIRHMTKQSISRKIRYTIDNRSRLKDSVVPYKFQNFYFCDKCHWIILLLINFFEIRTHCAQGYPWTHNPSAFVSQVLELLWDTTPRLCHWNLDEVFTELAIFFG